MLVQAPPDVSDARQLFGSARLIRSALDGHKACGRRRVERMSLGVGLRRDACRSLQYTEASQYNAMGFKVHDGGRFVNIGFDSTSAGGTTWMGIAAWSDEKKLGWWLPPQALGM